MVRAEIFRPPSKAESSILTRLLETDFPGRDAIREQLANCHVRPIDSYGSLEIRTDGPAEANVSEGVPVEAEAADSDGIPIYYQLHISDAGKAIELDVYKADGSEIRRPPEPAELRVAKLSARRR